MARVGDKRVAVRWSLTICFYMPDQTALQITAKLYWSSFAHMAQCKFYTPIKIILKVQSLHFFVAHKSQSQTTVIDFCCNYYIHVLFTTTGVFPFLYCMVGTQHQSHWHHSWDMTPNLIQHIFNPGLQNYKTQLAQTAYSQKLHCDQHTKKYTFVAGDSVWLPILTAGKLDPRWEGERAMKCMKSPIPAEVCNGWHTIVVYANRLQYSFAPGQHETAVSSDIEHAHECTDWAPPSVKHVLLLPVNQTMMTRYLQSIRRPFHWYRL